MYNLEVFLNLIVEFRMHNNISAVIIESCLILKARL